MEKENVRYYLDYMRYNKLCTRIYVMKNLDIYFENFTDPTVRNSWLDNAFGRMKGNKVSIDEFESFLEDRCFPRTRVNCDELLALIGLDHYSPIDIIRVTHGLQDDDHAWIRFQDEPDLTWRDVTKHFWRGGDTRTFDVGDGDEDEI